MARLPAVAIVGCGRAGGAIGLALKRAGYPIVAAWSRSREGRARAAALLDVPVLPTPADTAHEARVTVVAVPDDAVADVAAELAPGVRKGVRVIHTSGSVSVDALAPVVEQGGRIGCLHPLQTLPDAETGADALAGAAVAVTCDEADRAYLYRLVSGWGGRPFMLSDGERGLYHTAAVFASNYVVTTLWMASRLLSDAGVASGNEILGPLVRATVDNVVAMGPERAITGPIVRSDLGVVRCHVEALRERPDVLEAYRVLARRTAQLAGVDPTPVEEALA